MDQQADRRAGDRPENRPARNEAKIENDVTVGAYDVVLETGPSYTTKREEAKESMKEFIQSCPRPRRSSWTCLPSRRTGRMGDEFGKRFEAMRRPDQEAVEAAKAEHNGRGAREQPRPAAQQQGEQMQQAALQLELQNKQLENEKLEAEIGKIMSGGASPGRAKLIRSRW
jgi:hypothetical protein